MGKEKGSHGRKDKRKKKNGGGREVLQAAVDPTKKAAPAQTAPDTEHVYPVRRSPFMRYGDYDD